MAERRLLVDLGTGCQGDAVAVVQEGDGDIIERMRAVLAGQPELDVVVAINQRRILAPRTWGLLRSLRRGAGRPIRVYCAHRLESPLAAVAGAFPLVQPLLSVVLVLRLPHYAYTQVWRRLVRGGDDDVVGHGAGRATGGLVYWLDYARRADRCGERGLAEEEYFGVPLSVHCWPLALTFIRRLGFRRTLGITALLVLAGAALMPGTLDLPWALLLAATALLSTWAMLSVYSGTWEPPAWGLAFVAAAAGMHGQPVVAGVLLGLTAMTHPGVAALAAAAVTLAALEQLEALGVIVMGAVALVTSVPFVVPYLRSGRFLGRDGALNVFERRWSLVSAYQLAGWLGFVAVDLLTVSGHAPAQIVLLGLPAVVLYVNVKRRWVFSQYTVVSFMLFVGLQEVLLRPGWAAAVAFVLAANPLARHLVLASPGLLRGFDLTPVRVTELRRRLGRALWPASGGATGIQSGAVTGDESYAGAVLGFLLAQDGQRVFNSGYAEVGNPALHEQCVRHLALGTEQRRFQEATTDAGITTFVAFSADFARELEAWGARPRTVVPDVRLSPHFDGLPTDLHVLDLPWSSSRWSRLPLRTLEPNRVVLDGRAEERYRLPLTAFAGWRAHSAGQAVTIEAAPVGLEVVAPADGPLELDYRFRHYFQR